ncbi:MAG: zinc-binding dehydrogenase [Solirubrobacteraceae bacterium]
MFAATFREYGEPEVMRWEQIEDPVPAPDEVLIQVHACGLNHSDLDSRAGTSRWPFEFPHVLGAEFAGLIAALGSQVENYAVGQPVTALQQFACGRCPACASWRADLCPSFTVFGTDCWGGYGELVRVPVRALITLREETELTAAAAAQCVVSTAWHMVFRLAMVRAGETVLVPSASGGVAGAAVQCAKLAGARVIATVGDPTKVPKVLELGADDAFSYQEVSVRDAVAELTSGRGVDAVIDTVGGELFGDHLGALAPDGRLATCGAHGGEVVQLDIIELFRRGHQILGFRMATPEEITQSLRMVLDGRIHVPVARTFPLREAAAAHAFLARREHVGKVVLTLS